MVKRLLCLLGFGLAAASLLAQTKYVSGLAPDWNRPYDYPDAFDAFGPGPDPNPALPDPWDAWCTPTAGAMLLGHWEDVKGRVGLADGSGDGNQGKIPPGYLGPAWNNAIDPYLWHDRTADGSQMRQLRQVKDLGWYFDTNRLGDPGFGNGAHLGTFLGNDAIGLNNFFTAVGDPAKGLHAAIFGTNPVFGGFNLAQLSAMIKNEIDANRTVVAHFLHWNLQGPKGPGSGTGNETSEEQFGYSNYYFLDPTSSGLGEEWNGRTDTEGLGHSVLVVGYSFTDGVLSHLIVHDDTPTTVRNVCVPIGPQLVAITTVVPEPASLVSLGFSIGILILRRRRH